VSDRTGSRALFPPVTVPNRRLPTHLLGEAWLAWRCGDCGRVGPLSALPTACPDCGAGREALAYELED
jgi:rubrerythrin